MKRITRRLISTGICGVLATLLPLSFHISVWARDFTASISQEILNQSLSGKIFVSNDRYRMTLHPRGINEKDTLTVIVDRPNGKTIVLIPYTKTYKEIENFTIPAFLVDPFETLDVLENSVEKKKIGTETITGYSCDHYGFYDQDFKLADVKPVKGAAPWGRRIITGGEIQVKIDPQRPVKIVFYNRNNTTSSCTYTTFRQGDAQTPVKTSSISLTKKGQRKEVTINKNNETEWIFIQVDKGVIYANMVNERDPFSFDRYKLQDGYLAVKGLQSMGMAFAPARKLIVTITGDCQESPNSEISLICYQQDHRQSI